MKNQFPHNYYIHVSEIQKKKNTFAEINGVSEQMRSALSVLVTQSVQIGNEALPRVTNTIPVSGGISPRTLNPEGLLFRGSSLQRVAISRGCGFKVIPGGGGWLGECDFFHSWRLLSFLGKVKVILMFVNIEKLMIK